MALRLMPSLLGRLLVLAAVATANVAVGFAADQATASSGEKVSLQVGNWDAVQQAVAKHKGKIVVVDVWTTTCGTCVDEFPKFAALQKSFGGRVALIGVNCDYDGIATKPPSYYEPKVREFLHDQKATFENFLLNVSFIDILEQLKLNSTPGVYVYAVDGKLLKRFDNDDAQKIEDEFSIEDVGEFLKLHVPLVHAK